MGEDDDDDEEEEELVRMVIRRGDSRRTLNVKRKMTSGFLRLCVWLEGRSFARSLPIIILLALKEAQVRP